MAKKKSKRYTPGVRSPLNMSEQKYKEIMAKQEKVERRRRTASTRANPK